MHFKIKYGNIKDPSLLIYNEEDMSFDMQPLVLESINNLMVNRISLITSGEEEKVVSLWGFCGLTKNMVSLIHPPKCNKGTLLLVEYLVPGVGSYVVNENFPVKINPKDGWVCLGDSEAKTKCVEFLHNCIAVLNENDEMVALWLKPDKLPKF